MSLVLSRRVVLVHLLFVGVAMAVGGCGNTVGRDLPLDRDLAMASLETALKAWVDGKKPDELKPKITMGDFAWESGKTLASFEIQKDKARGDGTNLYIPVVREFRGAGGKVTKSETTYIVGTSPVITIFPQ
jgi:hypothetical protein